MFVFLYSAQDVEYFANAIYMDEKPAMRLLHDLATKGQTVRHLISYLEHLRLENALKLLKAPGKFLSFIWQSLLMVIVVMVDGGGDGGK